MPPPIQEILAQATSSPLAISGAASRTPEELANIVSLFASSDGRIECGCAPNPVGMSGCITAGTTIFGSSAGYPGSQPASTTTGGPRVPS
jgi:hypothetical protein